MNQNYFQAGQRVITALGSWMGSAFDTTATWVTQLSWWKFLLFALLFVIAGSLVQETLFGTRESDVVVVRKKDPGFHSKLFQSDKPHRLTSDDGTTILIDDTGLHITRSRADADLPTHGDVRKDNTLSKILPEKTPAPGPTPATPLLPPQPATTANGEPDLHISLPPGVGKEVRLALEDAVAQAAEQEVSVAQKKSSEWFMNFILLLIVGLFGTKALMGGKKRAEAQAATSNANAERATLQRQISEAKMQVMQAQVEPHFLFNTLASVEYLIETDPPRASAMQRRLIQYLRAVLPQMRETAVTTTLGREADMVRAYLDLLKMRMEERLQVEFQVPAGLRSAAFPPMMLQSLVENAIKHGLERKADGGTIAVLAEVVDNRLRVTVTDDGLGFGAVPSDGTGLGLQSIRERLSLLYQGSAYLDISANKPGGVRATIDVPYQMAATQTNAT